MAEYTMPAQTIPKTATPSRARFCQVMSCISIATPNPVPLSQPATPKALGSQRGAANCGRWELTGSALGCAKICDGDLQIPLPVPGVLLEREREIDRRAMFRHERLALQRAPGDAAQNAAV